MRKCVFLIITFLLFTIHGMSQVRHIEISSNGETVLVPITVIDSITYDYQDMSYNQVIWNKGYSYKSRVNDIEQVKFQEGQVSYNNFSAKEYGIDNGIINSLGQYAVIGKDTISNNGAVILIGDINNSEPQITVHIDSLKLVRYVYCDNLVYRYFYGKNDFTTLTLNENGDSLNCETYTYNQLQRLQNKTRSIYRTGGTISNSGWFNLFSLLDMSTTLKNPTSSSLLSNWASMQHNPFLSFCGDAAGLAIGPWYSKALILLKWFDNIWNSFVFRGATIETLPHDNLSVDAVRLKCNIKGLDKIPQINNLEAFTLCSMKLRPISGVGAPSNQYMKWEVKERDVNADGEQCFDFQDLLLESQYEYYPQLNLAWTEAQASIWVELSDDVMSDIEDWTIVTEDRKSFQSVRGEAGQFYTTKPNVTTVDPYYVYVTSAVVGCSFANVPSSAYCGIEYSDGIQAQTVNLSPKEETFPIINGLKPNTTYTYKGFVQTKYKKYYGKEKTFTTRNPSCSTGDVVSKTENSAIVKCYYANVKDDGFECGIVVSGENYTMKITSNSEEGAQEINIFGLEPSTTYNYWAYVDVEGIPITGVPHSFTTNPKELPDISGAWTCTEYTKDGNVYETFPVILHSDGTAEATEDYGLFSGTSYGAWSINENGEVRVWLSYYDTNTQWAGKSLSGTINNMENPSLIEGTSYWSRGHVMGGSASYENKMIMTR